MQAGESSREKSMDRMGEGGGYRNILISLKSLNLVILVILVIWGSIGNYRTKQDKNLG